MASQQNNENGEGCGCWGETVSTVLLVAVIASIVILWKEYGWLPAVLVSPLYILFTVVLGIAAGLIPILGQILYVNYSTIPIAWFLERFGIDPSFSWIPPEWMKTWFDADIPIWLQRWTGTEIYGSLLKFGYVAGFLVSVAISFQVIIFIIALINAPKKLREEQKERENKEMIDRMLAEQMAKYLATQSKKTDSDKRLQP